MVRKMSKINDIQKKGLRNVARRISQKKNVSVLFSSREVAYTDGYNIFLSSSSINNLKIAQGLLSHEAGHIGYGSFDRKISRLRNFLVRKYGISEKTAHGLINAVEDCRIDLINSRIFPGFYKNLKNYIAKDILPSLVERRNLIVDINLYLIGGFKRWEEF